MVRIARGPFRIRECLGNHIDKDKIETSTQEEIVEAFQRHHLIINPDRVPSPTVTSPARHSPAPKATDQDVHAALAKIANNSSPGPDRLSYRLLKLIKDTALGIGYTDGIGLEGVTGGATAEGGIYLGEYATVMDAEMLGIARAWEEGYNTIASDTQAAIRRCINVTTGY